MRRLYRISLALLLGLPVLAHGQQVHAPTGPAPQAPLSADPVLRLRPAPKPAAAKSREGRIELDVVVTGADGQPVAGLEPQDFKILDDGQPRKILSFRSFDGIAVKPAPPVEVFLLIDTLNLPFQQVAFVRQEIERFLKENGGHLAQPISIVLLTDAGIRVQPRSSVDGNALLGIVSQIKGSISSINPVMGASGDLMRFQESVHELTGIAENEAKRPGRKLLVWVGPGWPILQGPDFTFSEKNQRGYFDAIVELSTKLREARMAVYSVAPASSALNSGTFRFVYRDFLKGVRTPRQTDTGNLALKVLVTQSGGRILDPSNDLAAQIDRCIAEASAFYMLSFDPLPAKNANEYHDLRVEIGTPGLAVRTRTGYYNQPHAEEIR